MGIYAGMMNEDQKREYSDRELFTRYIKRMRPFRKNVGSISLFLLISTIAEIIIPLIIGICISDLSKANPNFVLVIGAGIIFLLLYITVWIMFYLRRRELGKFV
ncbi:hypothetical protein LCGC14_0951010, partial [marine sediment metagenome]